MGGDEAKVQQKKDNTWKLLSAIVVNIALFVAAPYALSGLHMIGQLHNNSWLILAVTAVGLTLKLLFGDLISGEFYYYKHGYDFCVITLGASLSSFALQLVSQNDLLPGLVGNDLLWPITNLTSVIVNQRLILLALIVFTSCVVALLTARIGRSIKEKTVSHAEWLGAINFVFGCGLFAVYVLMLIAKG